MAISEKKSNSLTGIWSRSAGVEGEALVRAACREWIQSGRESKLILLSWGRFDSKFEHSRHLQTRGKSCSCPDCMPQVPKMRLRKARSQFDVWQRRGVENEVDVYKYTASGCPVWNRIGAMTPKALTNGRNCRWFQRTWMWGGTYSALKSIERRA